MRISRQAGDITQGVIWKQLLAFFFPLWFGTFFQQLYNTVDTIVVGRYVGTTALAAVGSTGVVVNLTVGIFTGLSSGAVVAIAQRYGARMDEDVRKSVHTAMLLSVIIGAFFTVVGYFLTPWALQAMDTTEDALPGAILYLQIYFLGMIPNVIYNMGTGVLRAVGDAKRPLYFLIAASLCNIVLDLLLVVVFHMGVAGVAVATLTAQAVSAVLVTLKLMRSDGILHLSLRKIRFHGSLLKLQLKLGLPTGFESVLFAITNIAIQTAINTFGTDTTAAWSAYGKLDAIFWMVSTAFGISITTFVGQNYGAGKLDRVRRSTRICICIDLAVSFVLVALLILARSLLFRLFTSDETVVQIGSDMLLFITPWYIVYVFIEVLSGSLRGRGNVIVPVVITLVGVCLLRIVWLAGVLKISPTIHAIIFSYPVTWVITALAFIAYYLWQNRRYRHRSADTVR